jgi:release factor glutamine methyltransferase
MTVDILKKEFLPLLAPEDFYVLLAHASGKSREYLLAHPEHELDVETEVCVRDFFARRLKREPVAYITGEKEFFRLPFHVTPDTLIPRPETELLVEQAIGNLGSQIADCRSETPKKILIADIGTGSGAIIISLATELRNLQSAICNLQFSFHATDISKTALSIAEWNAKQNGVADMISFHEGNLIEPIEKFFHEADEVILITNLPYLSEIIYTSADDDVKQYEPKSALLSGGDGLDHYHELFSSIKETLSSLPIYHLRAYCEISPEQDTIITQLFDDIFPEGRSEILPDLSGRSRILSFRLNKT